MAVKVKVNYKQDRNRPKWRKGGRIYIPTGKMDEGPSWFSIILFVVIIPCWPIAAILGVKKAIALWKQKKIVDYRNYAAVIGDRCEVNVRELASKMGKTPSLVMMDLQEMIGKGRYFRDLQQGDIHTFSIIQCFCRDGSHFFGCSHCVSFFLYSVHYLPGQNSSGSGSCNSSSGSSSAGSSSQSGP